MSKKLNAMTDRVLSALAPKREASATTTICYVYSASCYYGGSVYCDLHRCYDTGYGWYEYCTYTNCVCIA